MQTDNFTCSSEDVNSRILKEFRCGISKSAKRRTWHMEFMLKQPVAEHEFFMQWNPEGNSIASILFIPFTTCPHELHEKTTMG